MEIKEEGGYAEIHPAFGTSAAVTAVLAPSSPIMPIPAARGEPMPRSCTTVRGVGSVAIVTETGSNCEMARKIILKPIRGIGVRSAYSSSRSNPVVKVTAPGGSLCAMSATPSPLGTAPRVTVGMPWSTPR
jgi:hypothetical protein